jgi:murein DD-endopeptidase MepM/ murein hydrolase activator NlpD
VPLTSPATRRRLARLPAVAAALLGILVGVGPAGAATGSTAEARRQLQELRRRAAAARVQLNLAVANDNAVIAEVGRLQRAVGVEQALVAADLSAVASADARVAAATARLDGLLAQGAAAHQALVARAVYLYEHPFQQAAVLIDGAHSLSDVSTREVLAAAIQAKTSDLIDSVRAQAIDEAAARRAVAAAQAVARAREQAAESEVANLQAAQLSEQRAHLVLAKRIDDDDAQLAGFAAQEAKLEGVINAAEAQYAAQIAAAGGPVLGPVGSFGLQWPIHGIVTQEFGHNGHPGIDIAAAYGTPIHASGSGVVIYASWESGYGNYTCIAHTSSLSTCYGHQSAIYVSVGQTVTRGEVIGAEGSTGYSTGPHVHFETRVNGGVENPRNFIPGNP